MALFKRCASCILSASFPSIEFSSKGICQFCRDNESPEKVSNRILAYHKKIENLIEGNRGKSEYDAVLCFSGGKDSTYTMMLAVEKYGLKVLALTLDNGFLAPEAQDNCKKVVEVLGVDHIVYRPSFQAFTAIIRATTLLEIYNKKTLTRISPGCNACISMVNNYSLRIALEKRIPLIIAGFTLGQIPANAIVYQNNYRFLEESRKPINSKLAKYAGPHILDYFCIPEYLIDRVQTYPFNLNLLCLEKISEEDIKRAISKIGWKEPPNVDGCSTNCQLNMFNNYVHEKRYGYHPYEYELSHLIRIGVLSREDALKKIQPPPKFEIDQISLKLGFNRNEQILN